MLDAPNWIPESYTGITDAFALFFELRFPNCRLLAVASDKRIEVETKGRLLSKVLNRLSSQYEDALDEAAEEFRNALIADEMRGIVRDPWSGVFGYIHRSSWRVDPKTGAGADFLESNYVGPRDEGREFGPDTRFKGQRQPVLVKTEAFRVWLSKQFPDVEPFGVLRAELNLSPGSQELQNPSSLPPVSPREAKRFASKKTTEAIKVVVDIVLAKNPNILDYPVEKRNFLLNEELKGKIGRSLSNRTFSDFFSKHECAASDRTASSRRPRR